MKKIILLVACSISLVIANAQDKMYKKLQTLYIAAQYEEAKAEIEKVMANPKAIDKAETWLWRTRIYAEIYFSEPLRKLNPGCGNIAFESFKKYEALESNYKMLANPELSAWRWRPLDLIYVTSFNLGRSFFEEKKWDSSYNTFMKSVYMGDVIVKNNLRENGAKIDTVSVLYAAYAAQNGKMEAEATALYEKFADCKIGGKDFKDAYMYILLYASKTKDKAKFNKYIAIAKEVYPNDDAWDDYEMEFITNTTTVEERIAYYDKEDAAGTLTARKYMLFGQSFSEATKGEEAEKLDSLTKVRYDKKAVEAFKKAYQKDNKLGIAAYNAGLLYYNEFVEYDDRISNNRRALQQLNSNKPVVKDPKKKAVADAEFKKQTDAIKKLNSDLEKPILETLDSCVVWLEIAYNNLKNGNMEDRTTLNCIKNSVKWLANAFMYKREKVKGKDTKAYDAYDAKYNEYDKLYEKY
ncbi:MAG TPA: hypothetical protein PKG56_04490 [Chitinophagaceae bacterium]|nr:hypothetical protein [Chitinophagaceae bacterium]HMZ46009.1 hypothetical protein [Chitinophagaceae bacterium]HNF30038.1 hypothetical protein [Chitinophagaceae bacterium]HNJ58360.1 hypothetical protein [Chitinophagaceae bacterium]HNL82628.1 hypothetical protein [Chitinophagaceae bacterium]